MRSMRACVPWLLPLLAAAVPAQQSQPVPPAPPAQPAPRPSVDALQREFDEAQRAWIAANNAARAAKDSKGQERLRAARPEAAFAARFLDAATALEGTDAAVPYLVWVVQRGPEPLAISAMTTLMDTHVASPGVRLAVARIGGLKQAFGAERSLRWLDRVLAANRDPHVLAQAHYTRAAMHVGTRAVATGDELRVQAIAHLEQARTVLASLPPGTARSLGGLVDALLDEARRLEPGLPAPEIEGQDLDGVAFKLSDYRGKVVLLDFWGDW
jgi:hypothetical protein